MAEEEAETIAQIAEICVRLGAPLDQSERMARQLWKRSQQLAEEQGIMQAEALDSLLRLMIKGRSGYGPDDPASGAG